jgi:hypothetical protein
MLRDGIIAGVMEILSLKGIKREWEEVRRQSGITETYSRDRV